MIDLIIPTMLAHDDFLTHYLPSYIHNSHISRIIIIDNSSNSLLQNVNMISDKIVLLRQKENIYVNPAWNLGVQYSCSDFIVLLNDDIFVSDKAFSDLLNFTWVDSTIICARVGSKDTNKGRMSQLHFEKLNVDKKIPITIALGYSVGHLMMMKRTDYFIVPIGMKILFGDDFLLSKFNHVYLASGNNIKGSISKTTSLLKKDEKFQATLQEDWIYAYSNLFNNTYTDKAFIHVGDGTVNDSNILLFLKSDIGVKYCAIGIRIGKHGIGKFEKDLIAYSENKNILNIPKNGSLFFKYQYFKQPFNSSADATIFMLLTCAKAWVEKGIDKRYLFRDSIY